MKSSITVLQMTDQLKVNREHLLRSLEGHIVTSSNKNVHYKMRNALLDRDYPLCIILLTDNRQYWSQWDGVLICLDYYSNIGHERLASMLNLFEVFKEEWHEM